MSLRKTPVSCVICGKVFFGTTSQICCSRECAKIRKRDMTYAKRLLVVSEKMACSPAVVSRAKQKQPRKYEFVHTSSNAGYWREKT